ncbi:hypothetical protein RRG08_039059 [Elysia crispata]|uniref:Uncharacterized protein n=1 Tax=Elysia crispata TaxID=231223 RepID=A0AAE1A6T4_9GAST|nr:hypothetical protein RRG08_039059 [Elysia crispata]
MENHKELQHSSHGAASPQTPQTFYTPDTSNSRTDCQHQVDVWPWPASHRNSSTLALARHTCLVCGGQAELTTRRNVHQDKRNLQPGVTSIRTSEAYNPACGPKKKYDGYDNGRSQKAEMQRPELKDHEEKLEEILPSLQLEIVMGSKIKHGGVKVSEAERMGQEIIRLKSSSNRITASSLDSGGQLMTRCTDPLLLDQVSSDPDGLCRQKDIKNVLKDTHFEVKVCDTRTASWATRLLRPFRMPPF